MIESDGVAVQRWQIFDSTLWDFGAEKGGFGVAGSKFGVGRVEVWGRKGEIWGEFGVRRAKFGMRKGEIWGRMG